MIQKLISIAAIALILLVAWVLSERKKKFPIRIVLFGLGIQLALAVFVLYAPFGVNFFRVLGQGITKFLSFSMESSDLLFGNIAEPEHFGVFGVQLALTIALTVIFFSSIVSVLYHYGIMQRLVYGMAWIMQKTMKTGGIESLSAAANIFVGQTEAPLLVRHYLPNAGRSEINSIMVGGFATIAGGVMAAFIAMGISAEALITASLISAPGGLMLSKIVIPPDDKPGSLQEIQEVSSPKTQNGLDAIATGASDGMKLALNIIAMLVAFIAIIAIVDAGFGVVDAKAEQWFGWTFLPEDLDDFFGIIFQGFAYLYGIPAEEAKNFGALLGLKISVNEFIAYAELSKMIEAGLVSERTARLATFALCGFANFSSVAIQIGGLGGLAPTKRKVLAQIGLKAMFVGALTNLLTTAIASLFI